MAINSFKFKDKNNAEVQRTSYALRNLELMTKDLSLLILKQFDEGTHLCSNV